LGLELALAALQGRVLLVQGPDALPERLPDRAAIVVAKLRGEVAASRPRSASNRLTVASSSPIDPFKTYIAERMANGCINALQLFKEINTQGFTGVYETVWLLVRRLALQSGQPIQGLTTIGQRPSSINLPTVFEITRWLMDKDHTLTAEQTQLLQQWLAVAPAVSAGWDATQRFTEILTKRQPERQDEWIAAAAASTVATLRQFAKGIQADHDAVLAALTLEFSSFVLQTNKSALGPALNSSLDQWHIQNAQHSSRLHAPP
jgi:transposase